MEDICASRYVSYYFEDDMEKYRKRSVKMPQKDYYSYEENEPEEKKKLFANIDKWKVFKQVFSMAASGCATMVVSRYLKANMPESDNMIEKAVMGVGMYFITGIVGAKVADYADAELDSWKESIVKCKPEETEVEDD